MRQDLRQLLAPVLPLADDEVRQLWGKNPLEGQPGHNVRVDLAHHKVVDVEHLADPLGREVLLERAVPPAPVRAVRLVDVQVVHKLPLPVLGEEVGGLEEHGKGRGGRHRGPDHHVGRRQVVEQLGRLVGVRRRHANVQHPPGLLVGLLKRVVTKQRPQPVSQEANVVQRSFRDDVLENLRQRRVAEEGEIHVAELLHQVLDLGLRASAHDGADEGPDAAPGKDSREEVLLEENLDHAHVEGPQRAAAAQHQRRPPKGVPRLPQKGQLVLHVKVRKVVVRDVLKLQRHLLDIVLDGLRDLGPALVQVLVGHVAQVAEHVRPQGVDHLRRVSALADLEQVRQPRLQELPVVERGLALPLGADVLVLPLELLHGLLQLGLGHGPLRVVLRLLHLLLEPRLDAPVLQALRDVHPPHGVPCQPSGRSGHRQHLPALDFAQQEQRKAPEGSQRKLEPRPRRRQVAFREERRQEPVLHARLPLAHRPQEQPRENLRKGRQLKEDVLPPPQESRGQDALAQVLRVGGRANPPA
mmetsp:Transcript_26425/g.56388  ORF Transcript_26425/g.56388 Transcript_26425/m.56388 type:complete len:526 (+) Transcript_26425:565-2142(+)